MNQSNKNRNFTANLFSDEAKFYFNGDVNVENNHKRSLLGLVKSKIQLLFHMFLLKLRHFTKYINTRKRSLSCDPVLLIHKFVEKCSLESIRYTSTKNLFNFSTIISNHIYCSWKMSLLYMNF